jgi:hypothetical protein
MAGHDLDAHQMVRLPVQSGICAFAALPRSANIIALPR